MASYTHPYPVIIGSNLHTPAVTVQERHCRTSWNAVQHVNRLPPELLVRIFRILRRGLEEKIREEPEYSEFQSDGWLPYVNGICRHWRDVINKNRVLWRDIQVRGDEEWLATCLAYSGDAVIRLVVHDPDVFSSALPLLSNHRHRIGRLIVLKSDETTIDAVNELLQGQMPVLTELCVCAYDSRSWDEEDAARVRFSDTNVDLNRLPSLQTLRFHFAYIEWRSASFLSKLRVLNLNDSRNEDDSSPLLTLEDFLDVLKECHALEELVLAMVFPFTAATSDAVDGMPAMPGITVSLPKIRSVTLSYDLIDNVTSWHVYHLLSHLKLPEFARVHVFGSIRGDLESEVGCRILQTVPQDPKCLPILRAARSAEISAWSFDCFRGETCGDGESSNLGVQLDVNDSSPWVYTSADVINDFCTLMTGAPLRELAIKAQDIPSAPWRKAFHIFADVTLLKYEAPDFQASPKALFDVLDALTPPVDLDGILQEDVVPLPDLRTLQITRTLWSEDVLDAIWECLLGRAARGARLSELHFEMSGRDLALADTHALRLRELQLIVAGRVVYKDLALMLDESDEYESDDWVDSEDDIPSETEPLPPAAQEQ